MSISVGQDQCLTGKVKFSQCLLTTHEMPAETECELWGFLPADIKKLGEK